MEDTIDIYGKSLDCIVFEQRQHVSDAAWELNCKKYGEVIPREWFEKWHTELGCMLISAAEHNPSLSGLYRRIAELEAELDAAEKRYIEVLRQLKEAWHANAVLKKGCDGRSDEGRLDNVRDRERMPALVRVSVGALLTFQPEGDKRLGRGNSVMECE